jgi:hypothetical protein
VEPIFWLVGCYGPAHKILWVLKNIKFCIKIQMCLHSGFTEKRLFVAKTAGKSILRSWKAHILASLGVMIQHISFRGFKKYQILSQNSNVLAFGFTQKCLFTAKTNKKLYFLVMNPVFHIG